MMSKVNYFFNHILFRDFSLQNSLGILFKPEFEFVVLHLSYKSNGFKCEKMLAYSMFILEYLTNQRVHFHFSNKDVAIWRLRKNGIVSVSVKLRNNSLFYFLEKLLFTYFSKVGSFSRVVFSKKVRYFTYRFDSTSSIQRFTELENSNVQKSIPDVRIFETLVTFVFRAHSGLDYKHLRPFLFNQFQVRVK